jgi:hypothetical protein
VWILALRYVLRWEPEKPGDMDWNEWDEKEQERRESGARHGSWWFLASSSSAFCGCWEYRP